MKKLFSVLLAVALMASMVLSASAATDLLDAAQSIYANDTNYATLTDNGDGTYTVVVTQDASADFSAAYGMAIEPFMTGVDLTATPYVNMKLKSDVPFRVTLLDKNAAGEAKWIGFGNEFFNTVFPSGSEAPSSAPENAFFPAGEYDCSAFLKGYYDWKTNNDGLAGYDPTSANVTAIYIELQKAGTLTLSELTLAAGEDDTASDNSGSSNNNNSSNNNSSSTNDNPKTGDTEVFALTIVALAAAAVVALSVVSKKAKSR